MNPSPLYDPEPFVVPRSHPVFKPEGDGPDRFIYHYTSWAALLDIAYSGLRFTSLDRMNDPRESKEWFLGINRGSTDDTTGVWKTAHDYRKRVRVATFCTDETSDEVGIPLRRGFRHPRMWAQYGGNHTGACIVLDRAGFERRVTDVVSARADSWCSTGRVRYVTDPKNDPAYGTVEVFGISVSEAVTRFFNKHRAEIFFTKHADWRDEAEFRTVIFDPHLPLDPNDPEDPHAAFVTLDGCVEGLVLGADFSSAHIPVAQEFMRAVHGDGMVVKCAWDRFSQRLIPLGERDGRWVVCRDRHAVAVTLTIGPITPKLGD